MNKIEELIENNHAYWLGGKTTYLGSPEYTAKARETLIEVAGEYFPEKKGKAIDVGCGNGDNTVLLASHFDSIDGYELSPSRVECAKVQNLLPNGSYKAMDIESELPSGPTGSMDAIFLLGVTSSILSTVMMLLPDCSPVFTNCLLRTAI